MRAYPGDSPLSLVSLALLTEAALRHRMLRRSIVRASRAPARADHLPSITVIRPVRGLDAGARENFLAALTLDYPGEVETIFVFDDEGDPALPLAREVIAQHLSSGRHGRARLQIVGPPPPHRTGKLNAMILAARRARGELLAFGDSDTRPRPTALRRTVEALLPDPRAGAAFMPVAVEGTPRTAGDAAYAAVLNAWYYPLIARAAARGEGALPFLMGQLMVLRRDALAAIGGLQCAEGQLVDDLYLGLCLRRAGYRIRVTAERLPIVTEGLSLSSFVATFRRWLLFSRTGMPLSITWPMWAQAISTCAQLVLVERAVVKRRWLDAVPALLGLWIQARGARSLHSEVARTHGGLRDLALPLALPALGLAALLSGVVNRKVTWRGRAYGLDARAKLAPRRARSSSWRPPARAARS